MTIRVLLTRLDRWTRGNAGRYSGRGLRFPGSAGPQDSSATLSHCGGSCFGAGLSRCSLMGAVISRLCLVLGALFLSIDPAYACSVQSHDIYITADARVRHPLNCRLYRTLDSTSFKVWRPIDKAISECSISTPILGVVLAMNSPTNDNVGISQGVNRQFFKMGDAKRGISGNR